MFESIISQPMIQLKFICFNLASRFYVFIYKILKTFFLQILYYFHLKERRFSFAFRNSVDRFLHSYEMFIKELANGHVYVRKKHTNKIFELLENDDDEASSD